MEAGRNEAMLPSQIHNLAEGWKTLKGQDEIVVLLNLGKPLSPRVGSLIQLQGEN